jgi:hypothetical protein
LRRFPQAYFECLPLASEKYTGDDPELAKCHIRYWLEDVHAGISGTHYNRRLLKWAVIERAAFHDWCERRAIPLPAFWFRPGWTDYRWRKDDAARVGGWKSRTIVDRYAKFATENLLSAASRIERGGEGRNVFDLSRFRHVEMK